MTSSRLPFAAALLLLNSLALSAQNAGSPPQSTPAPASTTAAPPAHGKRQPPKPLPDEAPGGGPDKVWVNINSSVYHCPGDRYYGRTAHGRYMTEAAAKAAGGHGPHGKGCPAAK